MILRCDTIYSHTDRISGESDSSLLSRAIAALPAFPGTFDGSGHSPGNSPNVSILEVTGTSGGTGGFCLLQRFKWKVAFLPSASCYMKIWTRQTTTSGDPPVITDSDFVWDPDPDTDNGICVPGDFDLSDHDTWPETGVTEVDEPYPTSGGGQSEVDILKYSVVNGYTPDDPPDGNAGWPP